MNPFSTQIKPQGATSQWSRSASVATPAFTRPRFGSEPGDSFAAPDAVSDAVNASPKKESVFKKIGAWFKGTHQKAKGHIDNARQNPEVRHWVRDTFKDVFKGFLELSAIGTFFDTSKVLGILGLSAVLPTVKNAVKAEYDEAGKLINKRATHTAFKKELRNTIAETIEHLPLPAKLKAWLSHPQQVAKASSRLSRLSVEVLDTAVGRAFSDIPEGLPQKIWHFVQWAPYKVLLLEGKWMHVLEKIKPLKKTAAFFKNGGKSKIPVIGPAINWLYAKVSGLAQAICKHFPGYAQFDNWKNALGNKMSLLKMDSEPLNEFITGIGKAIKIAKRIPR